ncbi:cell division protein CrgA [Nocardioides sp. MH1]|uniref:cell division protein CrgA n=1 Tax=Nocardioides sp. MH1 TaxID=3242490 RepID=UPI003520473E
MPSLKRSEKSPFADPSSGPLFSVRFLISLVLVLGGIAWIAYYYIGVRPVAGFNDGKPALDPKSFEPGKITGWHWMGDLQGWNYLIGFGAIMIGLVLAAHPSTPLGRGRGVVVGMLGCFLIGLLWICTYYVVGTGDNAQDIAIFNDLEQKNLFVGIAFMAVGFTFATKWE